MSLQEAIEKERERLKQHAQELFKKKAEIERQIDEVKAELKAITAYETARTTKPKDNTEKPRRARQTGMKQSIIDLIKASPNGLNRSAIIDGLGVRGDKGKEQTVSNTLANLKKKDEVKLVDGTYTVQ